MSDHTRLISIYLLLLVAAVISQGSLSITNPSIAYPPAKCLATEYFDTALLECESCPAGQVPDFSTTDISGNALICTCPAGSVITYNDCSRITGGSTGSCVGITCAGQCGAGISTYSDNSACMPCGSSTSGLSSSSKLCTCPTVAGYPEMLTETDEYGNRLASAECGACPAGQIVILQDTSYGGVAYTSDPMACQSCPDPNMEFVYSSNSFSCVCKTGYTIVGNVMVGPQSCIPTTQFQATQFNGMLNTAINIQYPLVGVQVSSIIILHYFVEAATRCFYYGGPSDIASCETLGNLCVLQMYSSTSGACIAFAQILIGRSATFQIDQQSTWNKGMPFLYYPPTFDAPCWDATIPTTMSLKNFKMHYVVAKYTINGTYLGLEDASSIFAYCAAPAPYTSLGGGSSSDTQWTVFGNSKTIEWKCDLNLLLRSDMYFYDMYYLDTETQELYAVPVRIVNYDGYDSVNSLYASELCDLDDVLVRRFFLFDIISGIPSSGSTMTPSVIRYASSMILSVFIREDDPTKIYTPVLTMNYTEVLYSDIKPTELSDEGTVDMEAIEYSFQSVYSMKTFNLVNSLYGTFVFATVLYALLVAHRYYKDSSRDARLFTAVDPQQLLKTNYYHYMESACMMFHSWNIIFFPFTVLFCWYVFVFFKLQTEVSILLPPQYNFYMKYHYQMMLNNPLALYYWFMVFINMMFCFQLVYVCDMIWKQGTADIFFLDWEPVDPKKGKSVSVWRSILVANEWVELMTVRRTSVEFSLFWIGFFLLGLNLEFNATQQPNVLDHSEGDINIILRFANTTWWWVVMVFSQWLYKTLIGERYLGEPPEQRFIDFCTVAKISVLVMEGKYHGYYLHCRSPHQFSDGSMGELVEMLHKEESGLTVDRSLEGAPQDIQSFKIFVSGDWRVAFDKIYDKMTKPPSVNEVLSAGRMIKRNSSLSTYFFGQRAPAPPPERVIRAFKDMTQFLQDFIENNFGKPGFKRVIVEQTYTQKLLRTWPSLTIANQPSVFVPERDFQYCRMMFLGRETDLLLLNILSYSVFDLWFNNTGATILLTYLLNCLLVWARHALGQATIAQKTPIDDRFLV